MNATSIVPTRIPLGDDRAALLARLVEGLDAQALNWLSGYAAGMAAERARPPATSASDQQRATILYGSQTGNGRRLAERLAKSVESAGFATRLVSAIDYPVRNLAAERHLFVVMSTHGDGDPPDDARPLVEYLTSKRAPRLENLAFAVFALGDSSYPQFCATGRLIDERLAALGARRLLARVDADLDLEPLAAQWLEQSLGVVRTEFGEPRLASVTPLRSVAPSEVDRDHPLEVEVLANQRITARGTTHEVRHIELGIEDDRLRFEPGDSLGVWPVNPTATVERIAALIGSAPDALVSFAGREQTLARWLGAEREITRLTRPFFEQHAARSADPELAALLAPAQAARFRAALREWQVVDLLKDYPAQWTATELVAALRPLAPRLYSISSSSRAAPGEVHLTVAVVSAERDGEPRPGAASTYLAAAAEGDRLRVYVEANPRFRLPADPTRDLVLIGPGTGVAPFRAFVQDRAATGAAGRQWLFFGACHFDTEFLYQAEWLDALKRGQLHRLDVAFSRDQAHKIYVQDRIREQGAELWRWLDRGAHVYVCGDAERMAGDVHAALRDVAVAHGGLEPQAAEAFLAQLAAEKRYLRDVY